MSIFWGCIKYIASHKNALIISSIVTGLCPINRNFNKLSHVIPIKKRENIRYIYHCIQCIKKYITDRWEVLFWPGINKNQNFHL